MNPLNILMELWRLRVVLLMTTVSLTPAVQTRHRILHVSALNYWEKLAEMMENCTRATVKAYVLLAQPVRMAAKSIKTHKIIVLVLVLLVNLRAPKMENYFTYVKKLALAKLIGVLFKIAQHQICTAYWM